MKYISLFLVLILPMLSTAQNISGGVRIGLNLNNFSGPSEIDANGNELESFDNNTGFLVGGLLNVGINDLFGFRAEVHFSQKGGRRLYEGQATTIFNPGTGNEVIVIGERNSVIRVNNSYIDIPVMAYIRPVPKLQIFGGVNVGFLISSNGFGQLDVSGISSVGQIPIDVTTTLDHNYNDDEGFLMTDIGPSTDFSADGSLVQIPNESGAYVLDFPTKRENAYNNIDFGLVGGVSYKLNGSLFVAVMYNLGLTDITTDEADIERPTVNGNEQIFREDDDNNRSLQLSLGFQF